MSGFVKWLYVFILLSGLAQASSDLTYDSFDRQALIREIKGLEKNITNKEIVRQGQIVLLRHLEENQNSNITAPALSQVQDHSKPDCSDTIFYVSLAFSAATIITGFVGPVTQFFRYRATYGRNGEPVPCSAFLWSTLAFIGSSFFLASVAMNQSESKWGKLKDAMPSATAGAANMLVYLSLFVYRYRYRQGHRD
ncbi:hypothetical protein [Endozoicomonas lisbonensis]|uniref:Uncharacterized protein n=1 Tax=Endozoicomonas lisbonensis TaxID=3120522 RepID=A0ABV2SH69_9GAMM